MGNLYDYFADLIGVVQTGQTYSQNSNVILCACVCVIVLFCTALKLISRGFDRLFGYNNIIR